MTSVLEELATASALWLIHLERHAIDEQLCWACESLRERMVNAAHLFARLP